MKETLLQNVPIHWGRGLRTHFPEDNLEIEYKSHRVLAYGPVNSIPGNPKRATGGYPYQEEEGAGRAAASQLCPHQLLAEWLCPVFEARG